MAVAKHMVDTWKGIVAALIACVLVMAPLAAEAKMAHHAANHVLAVENTHDHPATTVAAHHHDHTMAHDQVPTKSSQNHDHRGHHDGSCCGTYCHSACISTGAEAAEPILQAGTYATFTPVNLAAVAPDQPQRPPSNLLSI